MAQNESKIRKKVANYSQIKIRYILCIMQIQIPKFEISVIKVGNKIKYYRLKLNCTIIQLKEADLLKLRESLSTMYLNKSSARNISHGNSFYENNILEELKMHLILIILSHFSNW